MHEWIPKSEVLQLNLICKNVLARRSFIQRQEQFYYQEWMERNQTMSENETMMRFLRHFQISHEPHSPPNSSTSFPRVNLMLVAALGTLPTSPGMTWTPYSITARPIWRNFTKISLGFHRRTSLRLWPLLDIIDIWRWFAELPCNVNAALIFVRKCLVKPNLL